MSDGASPREQVLWRTQEEQRFYRVGSDLREIVSPAEWGSLGEAQRAEAIERVVAQLREEMDIKHETPISWSDDLDDDRLGYDEKVGTLVISRKRLLDADPVALIPGLAQEVRHAWQLDVIEYRRPHPLGEVARHALEEGLARYTSTDVVQYTANPLEVDAEMVEIAVRQGYASSTDRLSPP